MNDENVVKKLQEAYQVLWDCEPIERRSLGAAWAGELIVDAIRALRIKERLEEVLTYLQKPSVVEENRYANPHAKEDFRRARDLIQKAIFMLTEELDNPMMDQEMRSDRLPDPRYP